MDIFSLPVHPAAEVFPMLSPDDLAELAADIAEHGLAQPIVVKDGVLIDGRNRREACRIAKVQPTTTELNGVDPIAYIISTNINRRHMTKGQRAMAVAMIHPNSAKLKRAGSGSVGTTELSAGYLAHARTVLKWAPELSAAVLAGAESLDRAYAVAADRKAKAEQPERRLAALRAIDPDLADKVGEEQLTLDDAEGAARARRERERVQRQGIYDGLHAIERWKVLLTGDNLTYLISTCRNYPDELPSSRVHELLSEVCDLCTKAIGELP
jgi:ParB-like chromosome segregation protein Spo0J